LPAGNKTVTEQVQLVLAALLVLQFKHFIADFVLQSPYQFLNKGKYGHPGGVIHAGIHVLGTLLAFLVITPSLLLSAAIVAGEFIAHYHIDWLKERTVKYNQWVFPQSEFWWTFGADQALHQVTYVAIVAALAWGAGF
jgi:hypothetical protein